VDHKIRKNRKERGKYHNSKLELEMETCNSPSKIHIHEFIKTRTGTQKLISEHENISFEIFSHVCLSANMYIPSCCVKHILICLTNSETMG